jgi:hypothetical protein
MKGESMIKTTVCPSLYLYLRNYSDMGDLETLLDSGDLEKEEDESDEQFEEKKEKIAYVIEKAYDQAIEILNKIKDTIQVGDYEGFKVGYNDRSRKLRESWVCEMNVSIARARARAKDDKIRFKILLTDAEDGHPVIRYGFRVSKTNNQNAGDKATKIRNLFLKNNAQFVGEYEWTSEKDKSIVGYFDLKIESGMETKDIINKVAVDFKKYFVDNWSKISGIIDES